MSANQFNINSQRKSSTFNQYETDKYYDTVQVSNRTTGEVFNIQKFQLYTNMNVTRQFIINCKILPNYPFTSGLYGDFEIPFMNNAVLHKLFIKLRIKNTNANNALTIPIIPYIFKHITVIVGSSELSSIQPIEQHMYLYREINEYNKGLLAPLYGILANPNANSNDKLVIPANTEVEYYFPVKTVLSDINYYLGKLQQVITVRCTFRQNISVNPNLVADGEIQILKFDMILDYCDVTESNLSSLRSSSYLDYKLPSGLTIQSYLINNVGLTNGQNYSVKFNSFHGSAHGLFILIEKDNKTQADGLQAVHNSLLTDVYIQNPNNVSIFGSYTYNYNQDNIAFFSKYFTNGFMRDYFNDHGDIANGRILYIPIAGSKSIPQYFATGESSSIFNFGDGDYTIYFKYNGQTVNGNYNLTMIFLQPQLIRLHKDYLVLRKD